MTSSREPRISHKMLPTILGRYNYSSNQICGCCSVLEQDSRNGFLTNLKTTFTNFAVGFKKLPYLYKQPNLKMILKTSVVILITAESACILTAETVDLVFYRYSILLSVPLALFVGALTVVVPQAYKKVKSDSPTKGLEERDVENIQRIIDPIRKRLNQGRPTLII
jgi:hypothetical protein